MSLYASRSRVRHVLQSVADTRPAPLDQIDKHTLEIAQANNETYTNMQELGDELPDHSPRYVLLSYPLTLVSSFFSGHADVSLMLS